MRKIKSTRIKSRLKVIGDDDGTIKSEGWSGRPIFTAHTFLVGGLRNPAMIKFRAEFLNSGLQDASLFSAAVVKNKIDKMKTPTSGMSLPILDPESALTIQQQVQNKVALDALSGLNVEFVETPTSLLDEMNKDEDAGLISSSKYLGGNTLFTTESLLEPSSREKKKSITSETEIDVDISQVATSIIGEVLNRVISLSDNNVEILGKARR